MLFQDSLEISLDGMTHPMKEKNTLQAPCKKHQISLHALLGFFDTPKFKVDWLHQELESDYFD
jgi:hypothetical protein